MKTKRAFITTSGGRFMDGLHITVQYSKGNYGDEGKTTAETAIIAPDGDFIQYKGDDMQGWQTPADVLETLNWAASLTPADIRAGIVNHLQGDPVFDSLDDA